MCPHCGRDAPLLYRGALAYCSACNKPRTPLSATGVNLAGKPAKLGGTVASVVGWAVLAVTLAVALVIGAILQAIFAGMVIGWAVGAAIATVGGVAAVILLLGGSFLRKTGDKAALDVRREAIFALAQNQHGILRAPVVGQALGVSPVEAEAILTGFSRDPDSGITLEVDSDGKLYYRFLEIAARFPELAPPGFQAPAALRAQGGVGVGGVGVRVQKTQLADAPVDAPVDDVEDEASPHRTKRAL